MDCAVLCTWIDIEFHLFSIRRGDFYFPADHCPEHIDLMILGQVNEIGNSVGFGITGDQLYKDMRWSDIWHDYLRHDWCVRLDGNFYVTMRCMQSAITIFHGLDDV